MNLLKTLCVPLTVLALSATAGFADGKGHGHKGHGKKHKHHATQVCPPGLSKKSPACHPPGQTKPRLRGYNDDHADNALRLGQRGYRIGDHARDDCVIVSRYRYQSLPPGTYCRVEDRLLQIDPETRAVLTILQVLANN